jgi:hypothetical protein
MGILALGPDERVADVEVTADLLSVRLMDGRIISVPLAWYPRLLNATPTQRKKWKISGGGYGLHWKEIDEDLSTEGLLRGAPSPQLREVRPYRVATPPAKKREKETAGLDGKSRKPKRQTRA